MEKDNVHLKRIEKNILGIPILKDIKVENIDRKDLERKDEDTERGFWDEDVRGIGNFHIEVILLNLETI